MKTASRFIGVLLLAAAAAFAGEPALTTLKDMNTRAPAAIPAPPASQRAAGAPRGKYTYAVKIGTVKGAMNRSLVDLTINRLDWSVTGAINHSPVELKINHDGKTISGGANHSPVELKFAWSPEEITLEGGANHSPVQYTVGWQKGLLEGYANHSPLRVGFALNAGSLDETAVKLTGYANHAPVDLTFNRIDGRLGGYLNRAPVDITLTNCDLSDFLQYFFLFLDTR